MTPRARSVPARASPEIPSNVILNTTNDEGSFLGFPDAQPSPEGCVPSPHHTATTVEEAVLVESEDPQASLSPTEQSTSRRAEVSAEVESAMQ